MTTLRDVIAANVDRGDDPYEVADNVIAALLSAPESVRLELARRLVGRESSQHDDENDLLKPLPAPLSEDKP
jgi:hypothetical protein